MDWPALMRAGLHDLRLTPDAFWRLTPAELALMLGIGPQNKPLDRIRLQDLIRSYPDKAQANEEKHDG